MRALCRLPTPVHAHGRGRNHSRVHVHRHRRRTAAQCPYMYRWLHTVAATATASAACRNPTLRNFLQRQASSSGRHRFATDPRHRRRSSGQRRVAPGTRRPRSSIDLKSFWAWSPPLSSMASVDGAQPYSCRVPVLYFTNAFNGISNRPQAAAGKIALRPLDYY